ncbi:MAG: LptF/LptG family permease [Verrucomicrobia bacterium]|nr:LptF/LptG family permease [Verrucomicrobiota bacterium]
MNTLQRYILRQVVVTFLLSVAIFSIVLLTGNAMKRLLDLLTARSVPFWPVMSQTFYLLPFVLTFSLPMAIMTACLLVFGRLSADNEISAMRACGMSFWQLIAPVLMLAFVMSLVCLEFNLQEAPQLKQAFKQNLVRLGLEHPTAQLQEGRFNDEFPGYLIYVRRVKGNHIRDVTIYQLDTRGDVIQSIRAVEGWLDPHLERKQVTIRLHTVRSEIRDPDDPANPQKVRPGIVAENYELVMDVAPMLAATQPVKKSNEHMTFNELIPTIALLRQHGINPSPYVVRAHEQWAVSFACVAFAMIGIPFGIRAHRRETTIGIALALGLAFAYYFLLILAKALSNRPDFYPEILIWLPNLAFQVIGLALLWRISRVGAV